jgi:hypothetical protein
MIPNPNFMPPPFPTAEKQGFKIHMGYILYRIKKEKKNQQKCC